MTWCSGDDRRLSWWRSLVICRHQGKARRLNDEETSRNAATVRVHVAMSSQTITIGVYSCFPSGRLESLWQAHIYTRVYLCFWIRVTSGGSYVYKGLVIRLNDPSADLYKARDQLARLASATSAARSGCAGRSARSRRPRARAQPRPSAAHSEGDRPSPTYTVD